MDEQQQLDLIDDAFIAFRAGGPLVHPIGADAARATIKHRRRVRVIAATVAAVVAVMIPATGYATGLFDAQGPPSVPGTSTGPSVDPSVSESPPSTSASMTPVAPDGRITVDELAQATVDFGGTPRSQSLCSGGSFTFKGNPTIGTYPKFGAERYTIKKVIVVDFDNDGAQETVALVDCAIEGHDSVALALDRDTTGKIITVGQVLVTGQGTSVKSIFDVRADAGGAVGLQVGDRSVCCATTDAMVEHQWRSYSFDGVKFTQIAGRTSFTPVAPPADLSVAMTGLTLGKPSNGVRHGTFTVTVTNHGPNAAPGAVISAAIGGARFLKGSLQIATDLHDCTTATQRSTASADPYEAAMMTCHLFGFKVGESRTFTFRVTSSTANDPLFAGAATSDHVNSDVHAEQPGVRLLDNDPGYNNDFTDNTVTLS
jgi:hypothetical protein